MTKSKPPEGAWKEQGIKTNYRLLCIDGGGVRGMIPAMVLEYIEEQTGYPIHMLFDAISGTSTGALVALSLVRPTAKLGDAKALVDLYREHAQHIFGVNSMDRFMRFPRWMSRMLGTPEGFDLNDLWSPRYSPDNKRNILRDHFGAMCMADALLPVLIPTYDTVHRCPVFFTSRGVDQTEHTYYESVTNATMLDAVMAATAAPTYFPPHLVPRYAGGQYTLIDGSIVACNPAGIAHSWISRTLDSKDDIILSLGTGSMQKEYDFHTLAGWGLASWAGPALKMVMDGQAETVGLALSLQLPAMHYLRVQGLLGEWGVSDELDDCSVMNMHRIVDMGTELILKNRDRLDALCALLEP